jgi:Fasciclin domain
MSGLRFVSLNILLVSLVSFGTGQKAGTVLAVIKKNPAMSNFSIAVELCGLDSVLNDNTKQYTVFAPSNAAIAKDPVFSTYMTQDGWLHHLRANIQLMIVPNEALLDAQVFDKVTTELVSLNGTLAVSQPFAQVNLVSVQTPNLQGSNGVVHVMNGVIKNYWREYTLRDVDEHDELVEGLSPLLTRIGFDDPLTAFVPKGTSWVASRNRGYGNDSIALGFYPIVQDLKNESMVEFQNLTMTYNLLDFNLYEEDIERGYQIMVLPRGGLAHMWITKDMEKGLLRFNDAILDRQAFADNG